MGKQFALIGYQAGVPTPAGLRESPCELDSPEHVSTRLVLRDHATAMLSEIVCDVTDLYKADSERLGFMVMRLNGVISKAEHDAREGLRKAFRDMLGVPSMKEFLDSKEHF